MWKAGLLASCHHQQGHAAARVTYGALRSDILWLASPCTRPGRAGQGQSWAPRCTGWTSSSCKGCWGARRSLPASRVTSRACAPVSGRSSARGSPHYPGGGGEVDAASQYLGGHSRAVTRLKSPEFGSFSGAFFGTFDKNKKVLWYFKKKSGAFQELFWVLLTNM